MAALRLTDTRYLSSLAACLSVSLSIYPPISVSLSLFLSLSLYLPISLSHISLRNVQLPSMVCVTLMVIVPMTRSAVKLIVTVTKGTEEAHVLNKSPLSLTMV
jgi:hypothetical protein